MIYLTQTDTTAGFLSKDAAKINSLKARDLNTPCLITTASFKELQNFARVPTKFKNLVRRAKKTSFIYPNSKALRVVLEGAYREFLLKNGWFYSTSANEHGKEFNETWAKKIIRDNGGIVLEGRLFEAKASNIFALSKRKCKKIR